MMDKGKKRRLAPLLEQTLEMLVGQRSVRTLENYRSSINKAKVFVGDGWERLTVEDITRRWTDRFTVWLEKRHVDKPQTADFYLRTFRAVYGHALAFSFDETDGKPFGGHHPGGSFPAKRALKREEALRLLSSDLRQKLSEKQQEALDVLMFILYARGMVFKDVYGLTWRMVVDGHIRYLRSKTGVPIDVEVVPELEEIMKRYRREDSLFVFPFLHEVRKGCPGKELSEESALRRINRTTREIGRRIGLPVPLTTYVLRHTWATLMLEDGQQVELIGQCMGHTSIRTTQIYLSHISSRKVDTAVNGMYDRMLRLSGSGRKERDILTKHHRKPEITSPLTDETRNIDFVHPKREAQPHSSRSAENKKCPFLDEKETSVSCRMSTFMFSLAKVYISRICCKFSSIFFSIPPDFFSYSPFFYSFRRI